MVSLAKEDPLVRELEKFSALRNGNEALLHKLDLSRAGVERQLDQLDGGGGLDDLQQILEDVQLSVDNGFGSLDKLFANTNALLAHLQQTLSVVSSFGPNFEKMSATASVVCCSQPAATHF